MADNRYEIVTWRGYRFDRYTIFNIKAVEAILGFVLWVVQGSYNKGGVSASAGTHDGGGAADFSVRGMSRTTIDLVVKTLRKQGFAAWYRPPNWDGRGGGAHIHAELIGNKMASAGAKAQWGAFRLFLNGLANRAVDRFWHPARIVNAPYKTYKIRFGTWNVPGPDKLANGAARIRAAVALVKANKLHFVGWNEGVGIKAPHVASDFMHDVDEALGDGWLLLKPTLPLNENYVSYQGALLRLVKQYPDLVLPGQHGGRHLTRGVFEDRARPGFIFGIGQYHLVNGGDAETDRQAQAARALSGMQQMSRDHDDCPFILQGDANTPRALAALSKMKLTRVKADTSSTRDVVTFTKISATKPSSNRDLIIDHQHVTSAFYCVGYAVRWVLTITKVFRKPRASDHALVVSSVTHN